MSEEKNPLDSAVLKEALSDDAKQATTTKDVKKEERNAISEKEEKLAKENEELRQKFSEAEAKFEASDKERDSWKNKFYEAYADMANMRRQLEKEGQDFKKYANQDFIKELIPTLDAFDMALKNEPTDPMLKKYLEGFIMIHSKLLNTLKSVGVEIIDPKKGDEFNPNLMEALSVVEAEEDNRVVDTFMKGYKLKDHLLRASKVVISQKSGK